MTGQAIDATFPDIPLKQLRWSAAIREVGGIGYYPTSGVPFVHVDTGPGARLAAAAAQRAGAAVPERQDEASAGGRRLHLHGRRAQSARQQGGRDAGRRLLRAPQSPQAAIEIAEAEAGAPGLLKAPPTPVAWPAARRRASPRLRPKSSRRRPSTALSIEEPAPQLVQAPRPATPPPSDAERGRLDQLVTLASLDPDRHSCATAAAAGRSRPPPARRAGQHRVGRSAETATAGGGDRAQEGNAGRFAGPRLLDPGVLAPRKLSPAKAQPAGWAPAPEFDDDHPEELSYRPFPVAPLLTQSASADDEALVKIVHPESSAHARPARRQADRAADAAAARRSDRRGAVGAAVPGRCGRLQGARNRRRTRRRPQLTRRSRRRGVERSRMPRVLAAGRHAAP